GIELDTSNMCIRLPVKKLQKARHLVQTMLARKSVSLLDLQKITRYLNFISIVVSLGRTFLPRLYHIEIYFPVGSEHPKRRISGEAHKDPAWWDEVLGQAAQRSINSHERDTISTWTDAAGTKGLGDFFLSDTQPIPQPDTAFCIALPQDLAQRQEHINTQEMRAVEKALLCWGRRWNGKRVFLHTDNRSVADGIAKRTIRGASMEVLQRCLLHAT
ncbi:hypothetical protein HOY80DRAFT_892128, partial [Tuber brumale]